MHELFGSLVAAIFGLLVPAKFGPPTLGLSMVGLFGSLMV